MFHYPKGIVSNYCYNIFSFQQRKFTKWIHFASWKEKLIVFLWVKEWMNEVNLLTASSINNTKSNSIFSLWEWEKLIWLVCWGVWAPFAAYGWNEMESNKAKVGERARNEAKWKTLVFWWVKWRSEWARNHSKQAKQQSINQFN